MFINPNWRILTVGDGDLSFSFSLAQYFKPCHLTATVLDDAETLKNKYQQNYLEALSVLPNASVYLEMDITHLACWQDTDFIELQRSFDLVIFQFPLAVALASRAQFEKNGGHIGVNMQNRRLLQRFLQHSFNHFLSPSGARLAYITSKDVKPYSEWHIEQSLDRGETYNFIGCHKFDSTLFPDYQMRNINRDKKIKDTQGITYVWSDVSEQPKSLSLYRPEYLGSDYCSLCRAGPFNSKQERQQHTQSKKHRLMTEIDNVWRQLNTAHVNH